MKRAGKWLAIALGALVALVIALYTAGSFVEREHQAVVSAEIAAPPERVFAALTDVEAYPRWRGIDSVTVLSRDPLRWREEDGGDAITFEVIARVEGERLVTRIADDDLPFGGTWTYALEPRGDGTRLTITEEGFIDPPPFRVIMKHLVGYEATQREYLEQLAHYLD